MNHAERGQTIQLDSIVRFVLQVYLLKATMPMNPARFLHIIELFNVLRKTLPRSPPTMADSCRLMIENAGHGERTPIRIRSPTEAWGAGFSLLAAELNSADRCSQ